MSKIDFKLIHKNTMNYKVEDSDFITKHYSKGLSNNSFISGKLIFLFKFL
jgi:hypothetical protein